MDTEVLYIRPDTLARLVAQERVIRREDGVPFFRANDHRYPDTPVMVAVGVTDNAVHRRKWSGYDRRFIFEYVGDV